MEKTVKHLRGIKIEEYEEVRKKTKTGICNLSMCACILWYSCWMRDAFTQINNVELNLKSMANIANLEDLNWYNFLLKIFLKWKNYKIMKPNDVRSLFVLKLVQKYCGKNKQK